MRTVYFLGAGASKAIDPNSPLAGELLSRILGKWHGSDPDRLADLRAHLREFYDGLPQVGRPSDFEQLLTLIETALELGVPFGSYRGDKLKQIRKELLYCLWIVLAQAETGVPDDQTLEKSHLLKPLIWQSVDDPSITIITTNYDLLVEYAAMETIDLDKLSERPPSAPIDYATSIRYGLALSRSNEGLDFQQYEPDRTQLTLLKLHGSINWLYCAACNAVDWMRIRPLAAAEAFAEYWKCRACGAQYEPLVVPPAVGKSIRSGPMKRIWVKAAQQLSVAKRIVFAGFSLSEGDAEIRNLLLLAKTNSRNLSEVVLVDRSADCLLSRYENIYGKLVGVYPAKDWKAYLDKSIPIRRRP